MKQTIEFKKDCIMKTMISEITDISLSHDYKIMDDTIEGFFSVDGTYKITKSSTISEEFNFEVPFTIGLSSLIDKDSINLQISDFNYKFEKDILHLDMFLDLNYEESYESEDISMDLIDKDLENEYKMNEIYEEEVKEDIMINEEKIEETMSNIDSVLKNFNEETSFYKYKIYIMRSEDTIESIAIKYNVSLENLKEYNSIDNLKVGDKIIIPCIINE